MFAGKLVKWVRSYDVLWEYHFYNVEWVEGRKMSDVFWAKLYYAKKSEIKDKFQIWGFESFIFWSKFLFWGTVSGRFSQCNFKFFRRLRISPYSVRMRQNTDQKKLRIWTLFMHGIWDEFEIFLDSFVFTHTFILIAIVEFSLLNSA